MLQLIHNDSHLLDAYSQTVSDIYRDMAPSVANLGSYIAGQLIMKGKVNRALIGIAGQTVTLTQRMREYNRLSNRSGVFVFEIMKINALNHRKIKYGDIIVQFNRKPVESIDGLFKHLTGDTIGVPAEIGVLREGRLVYETIIPQPSAN